MRKTILSGDNLITRKERIRRKRCVYIAIAVIIAVAVFMIAISSVQ